MKSIFIDSRFKAFIPQFILSCVLYLLSFSGIAQNNVIDGVAAVVGNNIVLVSDIEEQYLQYLSQGAKQEKMDLKCRILEELMFQKLLVVQAEIDSVNITDAQVEEEIDKRIRYFIKQLGSKEKLEEYYRKSLFQIKSDFRSPIKDMLLAQTIQQKITKDIKVTPAEIKAFYKNIPIDSLPMIGSEVEVGQIVKKPAISQEEIKRVRQKITDIRDRIINGEKFSTLAVLYSEDPATSRLGGEMGTHARGELIPEFEAVAFNLKAGEVSPVIEAPEGFYIIQLIERKGDFINLRIILVKPKINDDDLYASKLALDSIRSLISNGKYSFEQAAGKFSDDLQSRNNKGLMINLQTGNSVFAVDELDQNVFFSIDKMDVADISSPMLFDTDDGRKAYRILYLKTRTDPHRANLKDDYDKIQTAALNQKKNKAIDKWIFEKAAENYIRIMKDYKTCNFTHKWEK